MPLQGISLAVSVVFGPHELQAETVAVFFGSQIPLHPLVHLLSIGEGDESWILHGAIDVFRPAAVRKRNMVWLTMPSISKLCILVVDHIDTAPMSFSGRKGVLESFTTAAYTSMKSSMRNRPFCKLRVALHNMLSLDTMQYRA